jgi:hypothetical protein
MTPSAAGEPWVILTERYGSDSSAPTSADLARAIEEIYVESLPGMAEAHYEEHGAAWIRYGYDDGPMYVLEVTRAGLVRFEEWADQDYEWPLSPTKEMTSVPKEAALQLWRWLANGDLEKVRGQDWTIA